MREGGGNLPAAAAEANTAAHLRSFARDMIDLHSHILPGIDDGAADLDVSLAMARRAVADGVCVQACTPHILPGVYNNTGAQIVAATAALQAALDQNGIALRLVPGADVHLAPDIVPRLRRGEALPLAGSRYVLVEPSHHVAPARMVDTFFNIMVAGYHPILTHPERLAWIRPNYAMIGQLAAGGVWMQITASSLTGTFGAEPKYWAQRMLEEGKVHILASDCHNMERRPPNLREGREAAAKRVGEQEAWHLVFGRPQCILDDKPPGSAPAPLAAGVKADKSDAGRAKVNNASGAPPASPAGGRPGVLAYLDGVRRFIGGKE